MVIQVVAPILLTVESLVSFCLAIFLLYKYGDIRRQNILVTILTLTIWFMSFVVIFLLPIDVSSAFYNDCLVNSHVGCNNASTTNDSNCSVDCSLLVCHNPGALASGNADQCQEHCPLGHYAFICRLPLLVLWYIIYWIFTILTWGILPFVQSYVMASYFSIKKKILRVILENVIYYASYVVILVIVLVSLLAQNTISMCVHACLFGYVLRTMCVVLAYCSLVSYIVYDWVPMAKGSPV